MKVYMYLAKCHCITISVVSSPSIGVHLSSADYVFYEKMCLQVLHELISPHEGGGGLPPYVS